MMGPASDAVGQSRFVIAPQLAELFKLVDADDYEDRKACGTSLYHRVGISPDGTWQFFIAGE